MSAGTTLQELDRLLRERSRDLGCPVAVSLVVDARGAPSFSIVIAGSDPRRSAFLSSAIDQALASLEIDTDTDEAA